MKKRMLMQVTFLSLGMFSVLFFCSSLAFAGAPPRFTSFDFPGAINTQPTSIAPSGDIVGRYTGPNGVPHGDPEGRMVGGYGTFDGQETNHGALIINGECTPVDIPGARILMQMQLILRET